jgi:hypothetical protein
MAHGCQSANAQPSQPGGSRCSTRLSGGTAMPDKICAVQVLCQYLSICRSCRGTESAAASVLRTPLMVTKPQHQTVLNMCCTTGRIWVELVRSSCTVFEWRQVKGVKLRLRQGRPVRVNTCSSFGPLFAQETLDCIYSLLINGCKWSSRTSCGTNYTGAHRTAFVRPKLRSGAR